MESERLSVAQQAASRICGMFGGMDHYWGQITEAIQDVMDAEVKA